jgi:hypothetical protein
VIPWAPRLFGWGALAALLGIGAWAWSANGMAILLDLAIGAANLLCL